MPSMNTQIEAIYDSYAPFEEALRALKAAGAARYHAYGPTNLKDLEELMPVRGVDVRLFATLGALVGLVGFYLMCVLSSLIYRLITGGKPPISNLPFVIISYEGTILCGSLAAFLSAIMLARLWGQRPPAVYNPRFSSDRYGVVVETDADQAPKTRELLKKSGAVEINEYQ